MLKNAFRVTDTLKTLTWVRTGHDALGKQTALSRPGDAALCEAALFAQAHLRTPMTKRGCQTLALVIRHKCQMPQSAFFDQNLSIGCVPPLSPMW